MSHMTFQRLSNDGAARRGRLQFPRGSVETKNKGALDTYFLGQPKSGRAATGAGGDAQAPAK